MIGLLSANFGRTPVTEKGPVNLPCKKALQTSGRGTQIEMLQRTAQSWTLPKTVGHKYAIMSSTKHGI